MKKKVLGISAVNWRDVVNFNIRLLVSYSTNSGERIVREAIFAIQTTDKEEAERLAIEKAKKQLEAFPYIVKNSVTIELKRRKKREV